MKAARCFLAAALLILLAANIGYSFDIAVYKDPLSIWNDHFLWRCRNSYQNAQQRFNDSSYIYGTVVTPAMMDSAYTWYKEMGVNLVMVNYPYLDHFDKIPVDTGMHIKVMNWFYPGQGTMHGAKYVDSQFRDVQVGLTHEEDGVNWSRISSIGEDAVRTEGPLSFPENQRRPVVVMHQANADTLWRATSYLGNFSGWDWYTAGWLDGSIYMPMHYRLTWAIEPDGPITTSTPIADFFWMVHTPDDTMNGYPNVHWWRFPVKTLTLNNLADTTNWITSEFYEDAVSGWYHLLDDEFTVLDSVAWDEVYYGPANPPRSLDDIPADQVNYGPSREVRMAVWYRGTHAFYLNRIQVWDEGAWRLFGLSGQDSAAYADSIAADFSYEFYNSNGKSAGWYYDEWDPWGEQQRSLVQINKVLKLHNLPTFYVNGFHSYRDTPNFDGPPYQFRNEFQYLLGQERVDLSVHMDEFYPFAGDSGCTPDNAGGWPTELMMTSSSSDVEYLSIEQAGSEDCPNSDHGLDGFGCTWNPYIGVQSLQCSIDGYMDPISNAQYVHDIEELCTYYDPDSFPFTGRVKQTEFVHATGQKFWALIQGGSD